MKYWNWLVVMTVKMAAVTQLDASVTQFTVVVKSDVGGLVTGATVSVRNTLPPSRYRGLGSQFKDVRAQTGPNGVAAITVRGDLPIFDVCVRGDSGRSTDGRMMIGEKVYYADRYRPVRVSADQNGICQTAIEEIVVVVKPVLNPIPMYYRNMNVEAINLPQLNSAFGFDLVRSDWVVPFGGGSVTDLVIRLEAKESIAPEGYYERYPNAARQKDKTLYVTFVNAGDGIQRVQEDPLCGSVFRLPRFCPERGYEKALVSRTIPFAGPGEIAEDDNWFFRVRSQTNQWGEVTNALYGKIEGPILHGVLATTGVLQFKYYLNPVANDRNMEYDPKRNLLERRNGPRREQ